MNELQQALVVVALVVVLLLYFLQRKKAQANEAERTREQKQAHHLRAQQALNNDIGEPHLGPVDQQTTFSGATTLKEVDQPARPQESVAEEMSSTQVPSESSELSQMAYQQSADTALVEPHYQSPASASQQVDDVASPASGVRFASEPTFADSASFQSEPELQPPEVYALILMATDQGFGLTEMKQALYTVGLQPMTLGHFARCDSLGNEVIKVANLMEPGIFPHEDDPHFETQGVVMILELPTSVPAFKAMQELIMIARKLAQRLNARIYNIERQIMKESDLQAMREAAIAYDDASNRAR